MHCEHTGVFWRRCQGKDTSSVLSARVRVIDCCWKRSSLTLSQVWTAAGRTHADGGQFGWLSRSHKSCLCGKRDEGEYHVHALSVCASLLSCCTLICTSPFVCGLSVASYSTNCPLSKIVPSILKPSQRAKPNHITVSRHPVKGILNHVLIDLLMPVGPGLAEFLLWLHNEMRH